ncbi:MAG: hypothetical protein H5U40_05160 [Polyangiaceae bacterium]|nr:hypothetical protein [Polyangiaceae bacterium]
MFSRGRPDTSLVVVHALGVAGDERRFPLSPSISADTFEVLQSMTVLERAVHAGPDAARALCEAIAGRVREAGHELASVEAVELATSHFDVIRYYHEDAAPLSRDTHVRCAVGSR